jgi:hypothetical protein
MANIKCPMCDSEHIKSTDSHMFNMTSSKSCSSYIQEKARNHQLIVDKITRFQSFQQKKEELEKSQKEYRKKIEGSRSELEGLKKRSRLLDSKITSIKDGDALLAEKRIKIEEGQKLLSDIKEKVKKIEDIKVVEKYLETIRFFLNLSKQK